ncbi:hypothetical protein ACQQ2N_00640 [Dokdonella sp. MW10]|uniref:hypothetical protein n=1 Tax=Dokdonella sp. MW10 TaxID=2992926 RepID=UPI003F7E979E
MTAFRLFTVARLGLAAIAIACVSGCSGPAVRGAAEAGEPVADLSPLSASAGVGGGAVRTDVASAGIRLPDYVPVRRYHDVFTLDGANRKVVVEYGWDYKAGLVVEHVYDEAGHELSRTEKPGYTLNFTDRELELAIALAREDAQLAPLLTADGLNYYAGFPYREASDQGCQERSRCVHVIVSAGDGQRHVAHAIVDLMTRRVIHAQLDPERGPDPPPRSS